MIFKIDARLGDLQVNTRAILAAGAKAVESAIRAHFRALPSRSGFFAAEVEGNVNTTKLDDNSAEVTVASKNLAHYVSGGTVYPLKAGGALSIPLTERARLAGYPSAGRIPDLFKVKSKGKNPTLCSDDGYGLVAHYVLVPSVTHSPHPEAWPVAEFESAGIAAMQAALDAQTLGS